MAKSSQRRLNEATAVGTGAAICNEQLELQLTGALSGRERARTAAESWSGEAERRELLEQAAWGQGREAQRLSSAKVSRSPFVASGTASRVVAVPGVGYPPAQS